MSTAFKDLVDNYGRTSEEREKAQELIDEINADAKENWEDPEWRRAMAKVLTQSILEGFTFDTWYDQIVNVERAGFDDRVYLEEETGLEVFYTAKGGHIEASSMVSEVMTLPRDTLGFHVYEFEDKMESNFAKSAATLRSLAVKRLDAGVHKELRLLVEAAIGITSDYYVTGTSVDQTALNTAIREVRDESDSGVVTIYGRSPMVDQITDFTGYSDEALEEIRLRGRLGIYRGASVVNMKNFKDQNGVSFAPANELYVIAQDSSKLALYGGLKSKDWVENGNWYWHYIGRQDFGGVVHRPERIRRFVDTSLTA